MAITKISKFEFEETTSSAIVWDTRKLTEERDENQKRIDKIKEDVATQKEEMERPLADLEANIVKINAKLAELESI